jgi:hypothetical protein
MLRATLVSIVAAASLLACSDDANLIAPRPVSTSTGGKASRSALYCTATIHPQTVTCTRTGGSAAAASAVAASHVRRNVIVGKQNVYVTLALNNFAYSNVTNIFSFNTTVQNLMTQPIGTQNGTTVAGGGVDVFFTNGPFVACGTGTVSPIGTSTGTFTASGQQFYQYNQIIKSDSVSASKLWQFQLSPNVCGFNFFVEVSGDLPAESSVLRWTPIHAGATGNQLTGVWQDSSDDVFAVGLNGTVLHYNGATWSALALNQPTYQLRAVSGSSQSDVWSVGDAGITVHYNGSTFTTVSTPSAANLKGVWELTSTNIYAVGSTGGQAVALQSTNGTSWTSIASTPHGIADTLRAVWAADASHIFVVGDAGRLLMYNGSGTWTAFAKPGGNPPFRGVWGTSATNVFAVATNGSIYQYNGTAWTKMTSNTTNELDAIGGTSGSNIWAVGVNGTTVNYNGTTWSVVGPSISFNLHGVTSSTVSPVWAVGDYGTLLSLSGTTESLSSASGMPIFRIWASGPSDVYATTIGMVLHYNGTSWSPTIIAAGDSLLGLWGLTSTNVHTLGVQADVGIYNGTSWALSNVSADGTGWRAEWGSGATNTLCAVGSGGKVISNSFGGVVNAGTSTLTSVWGTTSTNVFTVATNGGIYRSVNDCNVWTPMTSPTPDSLFGVFGSDSTKIWAVGQAGTVLFNSGGTSWATQSSGTTTDLRWVWADSASGYAADVYAVGDAGTIEHYNGTQWSPMRSGVTSNIRAVFGTSATNVYIGGDNGLVLVGTQ